MPSLPTSRNIYTANIHNTASFPLRVAWYPEIKTEQKTKQKTVPIYMDVKFRVQLDTVGELQEKWRFIE